MFYDLITGVRPHPGVEAVIETRQPPIDLELLVHVLSTPSSESFMASPLDVAAIIEKMCAYDPAQRYPSMDSVLEDLSLLGD